jgi:hypothetical protein
VEFTESDLNWTIFLQDIFGCSFDPQHLAMMEAFGAGGRVLNAALDVVLRRVRNSYLFHSISKIV